MILWLFTDKFFVYKNAELIATLQSLLNEIIIDG